jgi:hypothetical protein
MSHFARAPARQHCESTGAEPAKIAGTSEDVSTQVSRWDHPHLNGISLQQPNPVRRVLCLT